MTYRVSLLTPDVTSSLRGLQRDLDRTVATLFPAPLAAAASHTTGAWQPATDLLEGPDGWTLHLDVPGVAPEALEVLAEQRLLIVRGERAAPSVPARADAGGAPSDAAATRGQRERATGRFERRFRLPASADTEALEAALEHGVLTLRIPKVAPAQPRRITIATPVPAATTQAAAPQASDPSSPAA